MMKHIVCCALALFFFGQTITAAFAAPVGGAEASVSITGYGMLVPRTVPGGGGGSNNTGSTVRDVESSVPLETIADAEIPMSGGVQNSRLPSTGGAAAHFDYIWMLLLLCTIILLLARSQRRKPDYNASV